jgi:hypothetical protein
MKKFLFVGLTVLFLVGATSAYAIPTLYLWDMINDPGQANPVVVADQTGLDANPVVGAVTYVGAVGAVWWLNVSTGITKPAQGDAISAFMDLNSVNTSNAGGTVGVFFGETDFMPGASSTFSGALNVGGTLAPQGSAIFYWALDTNNILWGTNGFLEISPVLGPGAFNWSGSGSAAGLVGPYSLMIGTNLTHGVADTSSFDQEIRRVPEPGILILLGIGLSAVGLLSRRIKF